MRNYFVVALVTLFLMSVTSSIAQKPTLQILHEGKETSIRGLSVVDERAAWVSGDFGWVGKTVNRGATWQWVQVPNHLNTDFRDIHAFSSQQAIILSAGSPLVILRTDDGGLSWQEMYRDEREAIFFDGMDFWDENRGMAYGDPIDGMLQLMETVDGGKTWTNISHHAGLLLSEGEAGFAASGTGIRAVSGGALHIATGGKQSRIFSSTDFGRSWQVFPIPLIQGTASMGAFSIAFADGRRGVAVGGNYINDRHAVHVVMLTDNGGVTWYEPKRGTRGYRSCVEFLGDDVWIAAGTSGVDLSHDDGNNWRAISDDGYHVVRKSQRGNWVVLAGAKGRIAMLTDYTSSVEN